MLFRFKNATLLFASIFFLSCIGSSVQAQNIATFKVNNYTTVLQADIETWIKNNQPILAHEPQLVILKFNKICTEDEKQTLANHHIVLQEYLGSNTYSAWVSTPFELLKSANIIGIAAFLPEYKIANSIRERAINQTNITILVSFFKEISALQVQQIVTETGGAIVPDKWQSKGYYKIQIAADQLKSFAIFFDSSKWSSGKTSCTFPLLSFTVSLNLRLEK